MKWAPILVPVVGAGGEVEESREYEANLGEQYYLAWENSNGWEYLKATDSLPGEQYQGFDNLDAISQQITGDKNEIAEIVE